MAVQRVAFQFGERWYRFAVNPKDYKEIFPQRSTAVKTKSRIMVQDFQRDIASIQLSGSTGDNRGQGYTRIQSMKNYLKDYSNKGGDGFAPPDDFYFHNFTNGESFVVHIDPEGVTFSQSVESPRTFNYSIAFNILRYAGEPDESGILEPEIGNMAPTINEGEAGGDISDINLPVYERPTLNPQDRGGDSYQLGIEGLRESIGYQ